MASLRVMSRGYHTLTPPVQRKAQELVASWVYETGRFLRHDALQRWVPLDNEHALLACHKQLLMASVPLMDILLRQLDSLKADAKWGPQSRTSLFKDHTPSYLKLWEEKFLPPSPTEKVRKLPESTFPGLVQTFASSVPRTLHATLNQSLALPLRPKPQANEDMRKRWINEGDTVEAMFQCKVKGETCRVC